MITPINNLICTQTLTYTHTVQVVCIHRVGGGAEYRQFRKVREVLSETISCASRLSLLYVVLAQTTS